MFKDIKSLKKNKIKKLSHFFMKNKVISLIQNET